MSADIIDREEIAIHATSMAGGACSCLPYCVATTVTPAEELLEGLTGTAVKATSAEGGWPRTNANDGDDGSHWSANPGGDVANTWWAADVGATETVDRFRIYSYNPAEPGTALNIATEVRIYGTDDPVLWANLVNGGGKLTSDPAASGWVLVHTYTTALVEPSDSGITSFGGQHAYRYWLFKAIAGGSSEWDVNTLELWTPEPVSGSDVLGPVAGGAVGTLEGCLVHPDHQHDLQTAEQTPVSIAGVTADNLDDALTELAAAVAAHAFGAVDVVIDGRGTTIATGFKTFVRIPYDLTIVRWSLLADTAGSAVVDIWRDTYANFPPVVGDSITAAAKPTLSSAQKNEDTTLSGWSAACPAGSILGINVDSLSGINRLTLELQFQRT